MRLGANGFDLKWDRWGGGDPTNPKKWPTPSMNGLQDWMVITVEVKDDCDGSPSQMWIGPSAHAETRVHPVVQGAPHAFPLLEGVVQQ